MARLRRKTLSRGTYRRRQRPVCSIITLPAAMVGFASLVFLAIQLTSDPVRSHHNPTSSLLVRPEVAGAAPTPVSNAVRTPVVAPVAGMQAAGTKQTGKPQTAHVAAPVVQQAAVDARPLAKTASKQRASGTLSSRNRPPTGTVSPVTAATHATGPSSNAARSSSAKSVPASASTADSRPAAKSTVSAGTAGAARQDSKTGALSQKQTAGTGKTKGTNSETKDHSVSSKNGASQVTPIKAGGTLSSGTNNKSSGDGDKNEGHDGAEDTAGEDDGHGHSHSGEQRKNVKHASVEVRHGNNVLRIPRGSRVTGKLPEFLGVVPTNGGLVRGQNITRVSYALYKIVKLFGFGSMIDSPAGSHVEWMAETLHRIEFDRPSFKYWGIDSNCSALQAARTAVGDAGSSELRCGDVLAELPREVDVLFHWPELDGSARDPRSPQYASHIEKVLESAKRANATYIIFGQYPRVKDRTVVYRYGKWIFSEDPGDRPFLLNDHVRGVVPVINSKDPYVLYMTFYSIRALHI